MESKTEGKEIALIELGITGHEDLGRIGNSYCDRIYLGPLSKLIKLNRDSIKPNDNMADKRLENLKIEIKKWFDELKKYNRKYSKN